MNSRSSGAIPQFSVLCRAMTTETPTAWRDRAGGWLRFVGFFVLGVLLIRALDPWLPGEYAARYTAKGILVFVLYFWVVRPQRKAMQADSEGEASRRKGVAQ